MVVASSFGLFSAFFFHRFAAHQNFKHYGIIDSTRALVMFFFLVPFSWMWGLQGTAAGYLSAEIVICLYSAVISFKNCGKLGVNFDYRLLWIPFELDSPLQ